MSIGERIQMTVGITLLCAIYYMIFSKAFQDISALIQTYPNDFWPAFLKYILSNLGGG